MSPLNNNFDDVKVIKLHSKIIKNNIHFYNLIGKRNLNETYSSFQKKNSTFNKSREYQILENKIKHEQDLQENSQELLVNSNHKDSISSENISKHKFQSRDPILEISRNNQI